MSPTTRAKDWLARTPPSTDSTSTRTPSVLGVQGSRVTKHVSVQSTTTSPAASEGRDWRAFEHPFFNKKVAGKDDDEDYVEDVEDSTLLEEEEEEDDGGKLGNDTTLVEEQDESEDDDELGDKDLKISQAEQDAIVDFEAERAKRTQAAAEIEQGDWSEEEVALFQKLCLRGCEPLLPGNWRMDFKTIPPVLFTVDEDEEAFLGPASGRDFRGMKIAQPSCTSNTLLIKSLSQQPKRSPPSSASASAPATKSTARTALRKPSVVKSNPTFAGPNSTATSPPTNISLFSPSQPPKQIKVPRMSSIA